MTNDQVASAAAAVADRLRSRSCVLFLGDEIGEGHHSEATWVTRQTLLKLLRSSRSYVTRDMDLSEALYAKESVEGRASVISFLREQLASQGDIDNAIVSDLITLPFSAIVTTNWSTICDTAAQRAGVRLRTVAVDDDVPDYRFAGQIQLKLLGSLDGSLQYSAAASPIDVFDSRPLVRSLFRVLCSNTPLVFIGYSRLDPEFQRLFRWITHFLGAQTAATYLISPDWARESDYWSSSRLSVINSGTLDFAQRLHAELLRSNLLGQSPKEEHGLWLENPLFRPLFRVRTLPTESQVIEGTVETVLKLLDEDQRSLSEIGQSVLDSMKEIVRFRPNYKALADLVDHEVANWFPPLADSREQAQLRAERYLEQRRRARDVIAERGSMLIREGDRLLLYVHSTRVCSVVQRWLHDHKRRSSLLTLVIPEARPKSPQPFQNGLETAIALKNSDAEIVLIPDMSIASLMQRGMITKAFFGAHKVGERADGSIVITNVTGTQPICILAERWKIPVFFFAEEEKVTFGAGDTGNRDSSLDVPEESILDMHDPLLGDLSYRSRTILQNPGYDQVDSREVAFRLITEERELPVSGKQRDA